nr:zinc metalloprotease zmpb [Quercus suber]
MASSGLAKHMEPAIGVHWKRQDRATDGFRAARQQLFCQPFLQHFTTQHSLSGGHISFLFSFDMAFTRAQALRSLHGSIRYSGLRATPRAGASARTQLAVTKRFASGGGAHGHGEPSSDMPWLFGAIAITIPSCWYLWPTASHAEHHGSHDAHAEESHDDEKDEEAPAEDAPAEEEPKDDEAPKDDKAPKEDEAPKEDADAEKDEKKEDEQEDKPADKGESAPKDSGEGGSDKTGVGKGKGKDLSDTRKHEPSDSKGAAKKRIDSGLGKDLGAGPDFDDQEGDKPKRENSATSKTALKGAEGEISSKQFGLSTTATRHSTQIDQDPEKSKKGEGTPETAKSMGTVSVDRPARCSNGKRKAFIAHRRSIGNDLESNHELHIRTHYYQLLTVQVHEAVDMLGVKPWHNGIYKMMGSRIDTAMTAVKHIPVCRGPRPCFPLHHNRPPNSKPSAGLALSFPPTTHSAA